MIKMPIKKIGDTVYLSLTDEILKQLDLCVEDEVEIMIADRQLIVTPLPETERKRKIDDAIQSTFERRRKVYQKLAEGG